MNKTLIVSKWEIKKNITNKAFLISIAITPLIAIIFGFLPGFIESLDSNDPYNIYIVDEIGVFNYLDDYLDHENFNLIKYNDELHGDLDSLRDRVIKESRSHFIVLNEEGFINHEFEMYIGDDSFVDAEVLNVALNNILREYKISNLDMDRSDIEYVLSDISIKQSSLVLEDDDILRRLIPGILAGLILFSSFISGTMTYNSATQEKRDKMTEVLLSSMKPVHLMQGKIIGYFVLGLIQVMVWAIIAFIVASVRIDISIVEYLFVRELPLMLLFALLGYLLFSSVFVSMGATVNDIYTAGTFQSLIFLLPMLPFFFIGAIINNPNGMVATVGSYFPLTTSGVMVFRLVLSSEIPRYEIIISLIILIVSTIIIMKLAGKIFKTALLMYGKNPSLKEIFKWVLK